MKHNKNVGDFPGAVRPFIAIAILIACLEIVLRVWVLQPAIPATDEQFFSLMKRFHPESSYKDFADHKRSWRILGLSDSVGQTKDEKDFYRVLEKRLNSRGDREVEVINIAVPGTGIEQQLLLLEKFGMRFSPDVVIHGLSIAFDVPVQSGKLVIGPWAMLNQKPWNPFKARSWVSRDWFLLSARFWLNEWGVVERLTQGAFARHAEISGEIRPRVPGVGGLERYTAGLEAGRGGCGFSRGHLRACSVS